MNKCSMKEYDSFKMYFQASITIIKMSNSKIVLPIKKKKKITAHFLPEHHFRP